MEQTGSISEKAVLASLVPPEMNDQQVKSRIDELKMLCQTAGVEVINSFQQKRSQPDSSYFIGRGKLEEIKEEIDREEVDVVIFNEEITPLQSRNLENYLETRVLDRTALILDIFATRARSREGKLQVEMAQLQYLLPRLTGYGEALSRLGGGIGTRGPGETKLEIDRRRIRKRITELSHSLEEVKKHRSLHRKQRKKDDFFTVSLVGYTNAGKSTLLNALSGEQVFTENKLFATLDTTVRKVPLENENEVLLSDTVGFIQEMPEQLMKAFKATLEEINEAGLILHVVDLSHPEFEEQIKTVENVLNELTGKEQQVLMVFNKMDKLAGEEVNLDRLKREFPGSTFISAVNGSGLEELKRKISRFLHHRHQRVRFSIPYDQMDFLDRLYRNGRVIEVKYENNNIFAEAEAPVKFIEQNRSFLVKGTELAEED